MIELIIAKYVDGELVDTKNAIFESESVDIVSNWFKNQLIDNDITITNVFKNDKYNYVVIDYLGDDAEMFTAKIEKIYANEMTELSSEFLFVL